MIICCFLSLVAAGLNILNWCWKYQENFFFLPLLLPPFLAFCVACTNTKHRHCFTVQNTHGQPALCFLRHTVPAPANSLSDSGNPEVGPSVRVTLKTV